MTRPPLRRRMPLPAFKPPPELPEGLQRMLERAKNHLVEEFKGITADGQVRQELFPVHKTGRSLKPLFDAACAFHASLDAQQRTQASFGLDAKEWRAWCNVHPFLMRHGLCLGDLGAAQRDAALAIVSAALSAGGYESARNVMKLNEHVAELTGLTEEYGEWYYWMSLMGTPSLTEPWGWQLDGHHLILNCLIYADQMVLTPAFFGSEPVSADSGKYAGTALFRAEESSGLAMMRALTPEQRAKATIGTQLPGEVLAAAFADNARIPYEGIRYDELSPAQQGLLVELIGVYVNHIRPGHAELRMEEVREHLRATHFSWIGQHDDASPFYYRVYSPVILIEFDHQPGLVFQIDAPSRDHVHTVVRTPNGNDYGKDLLRQHYAQFDHKRQAR